jgi:type I restriction enzyme, S subunit
MSDKARWPEVRLGDHARVKARLGWKGLKAEEYVLDGPIFLAAPNLRGGRIDFDHVDHLTQWRYDESPEIQLAIGDVLLVKDGSTLGMSAFVRELPAPTTVNGSIAVIRSANSLVSGFLFYSINGQRFQRLIWLKRAGLGVPHLFQADLREFQIPLPPPAEQNRIAEILSTLDETIRQTEALIAKYQQIKAGLMQDLFTRGVTPDWHLRPTRAQAPELYKESPLGWIPREWEAERLGAVLSRSGGYLQTGPFGSQLHAHEYVNEGVPVVMPQDINDGAVSTEQIARIGVGKAQELSRHRMRLGDVIIARRGDLSRAAAILDPSVGWLCGTGCFLLRLGSSALRSEFAACSYRHPAVQRQIAGVAVGTTMPSLNNRVMERLLFFFCDVAEQDRILCVMRTVNQSMTVLQLQLDKLRQQKLGLMHDLLTGRVRVKVAESEAVPA